MRELHWFYWCSGCWSKAQTPGRCDHLSVGQGTYVFKEITIKKTSPDHLRDPPKGEKKEKITYFSSMQMLICITFIAVYL